MARRIQGITIELDGETKGLDKALSDVNKRSRDLQSELKDVDRLLKFNPGNAEAIAQKQKLLADQVEVTTDRLNTLKKAQQQVEAQFASGKINEQQYRNFKREVEFTEGSLSKLRQELTKVQSEERETVTSTNKLERAFKDAGDEAKEFGRAAADGIGKAGLAGAAGIGGLVTGMQDYNQVLARLKANSTDAGRDLGLVEEAFRKITSITGEADAAGETLANLLASGFSDEQLSSVIDQVNGAYIRFSDTLKTEGIADGIQETLAAGEAVGPFAELLERSGIKLDDFNKKLADAKAKGEGTNLVLQTMTEQGFGKLNETYKELNPEVQKNAEANANLQKSLADLAIVLTPLVENVTSFITKAVEWATANPELTSTITAVGISIGVLTGLVMILAPAFTALATAAGLLNIGLLPIIGIAAAVVVGIAGLIAIGVLLYKNWDTIKAKSIAIWNSIKQFLTSTWNSIKSFVSSSLNSIGQAVSTKFSDMLKAVSEKMGNVLSKIKEVWGNVMDFLGGIDLTNMGKDMIKGLINGIKAMAGKLVESAKGVVGDAVAGAKKLLGIKSPSRVFKQIGVYSGEGLELGLNSMAKSVQRAGERMTSAAIPDAPNMGVSQPQSITHSPSITIQNMSVRDDSDIKKIARELHNLTKMSGRRVGTV